jgi:hypothetical protein
MAITITFDTYAEFIQFVSNDTFFTNDGFLNTDTHASKTKVEDTIVAYNAADNSTKSVCEDHDDFAVGDIVHWDGRKLQFDGEIIEMYRNDDNDAVVRIRRHDTGSVVKITFDRDETGVLTRI